MSNEIVYHRFNEQISVRVSATTRTEMEDCIRDRLRQYKDTLKQHNPSFNDRRLWKVMVVEGSSISIGYDRLEMTSELSTMTDFHQSSRAREFTLVLDFDRMVAGLKEIE